MHFSIDSKQIKKMISSVSGALSKDKNSILSNYFVNIENNLMYMTSSNEVLQITTSVSIESGSNFSFVAKPELFDRLKVLNGKIEFEAEENLLTIKNGSYITTAKIYPSEEYQLQTIDNYTIVGDFDYADYAELFKVNIATNKVDDQTREFSGVLFEIDSNKFNCVATNRSRLFWISKPIENDIKFYCIVERDGILQLNRLIKATDKMTLLYNQSGDNITQVAFQFDDITIISKVINGRFPQYSAIILHDNTNMHSIAFDRNSLRDAIQRVIALSADETSALEFDIKDTCIDLKSTNSEGEEAKDIVEIKEPKDVSQMKIMLNGKYTLDFLNSIQSEEVEFYYKEAKKPLEMKSNYNSIDYIYIMTPVK